MDREVKLNIFEKIGPDVKRTAVKVIDILDEHGRIPKNENTLRVYLGNDNEALKVMKDPEKLKELLFVLQTATDEFMYRAEILMKDKRRTLQEKAQMSLDIANAVLVAEKEARVMELKNISDLMGNRGLCFDLNI